jgi:hypothetical protein
VKVKKILAFLFILFTSFSLFSQQAFVTPQTVAWDAPVDAPTIGTIEYEVFLIPLPQEMVITEEIRARPHDLFFGRTSELSMIVDLATGKLEGDYVVAIRTVHFYNDFTERSEFAYSDKSGDCYNGETFFLRFTKGISKPTMIRFNEGN